MLLVMSTGGRSESGHGKDPASDGVPRVVAADRDAGGATQTAPQFRLAPETIDRLRQGARVARPAQQTVDLVFDELSDLTDATRDDRQAGRHVFVNLQRRKIE